ncbi:Aromatic-ring hydroxylase-like protein [Cordyceps fumosorosea ARSEF 2679]|uniref:Aromatic-ring hydroxylase-like protein n=1 Tax=Cordyceps fumosorosea (strain ARSEF 2679) TaxID=1081104 RepID=A0A167YCF6_CORFA|nr:Aromatic-ring hydroxylase-like protein [Cordyceps fumosorosea ARSEF 2679]OAA66161.1 Aromatic-ring hydroxylase-like protein [Cordyceps fumosorosea ARSEF 2679]
MDSHAPPQPPILIVGGGLAGLALAQGLLNASIPFRLFERDPLASSRPQGYRIRVTTAALRVLLPPPILASLVATASVPILPGHAISALTGEPDPEAFMPGGPPPGGGSGTGELLNADRAVLREVLLQGLGSHMSYGKTFASYAVLPDGGGVEVRFKDGSVARGALLIGADGARSAVRRQLLPGFPLVDTEGRSVFGKTPLTPSLTSRLPPSFLSGMCLASLPNSEPPTKLLFEAMRFDRAAPAAVAVPEDYIYWVLCARSDVTNPLVPGGLPTLLGLAGEASADLARAVMRGWYESLVAVTGCGDREEEEEEEEEEEDHSSTATLAFFSCTADGLPRSWERLRRDAAAGAEVPVTLIGDAAHPMPPVGGVGANSAFEDALELCRALTEESGHGHGGGGQVVALAQYERSMVQRVGEAVERSSQGARRFFGMKPRDELKPIEV